MIFKKNRRDFLRNTITLVAGTAILPGVTAASNSNNQLVATGLIDLRTGFDSGKELKISGTLYDNLGLGIRNDASIEVVSSTKDEVLGKVYVNDQGKYCIVSEFPKREGGRSGRISLRISSPQSSYDTELIVNELDAYITDKHWEMNHKLGDRMFPVKKEVLGQSHIQFNLSV